MLAYVVKIAGDTEKYWCGIKHHDGGDFIPPKHHQDFLPYNDQEALNKLLNKK
jgi:hypothetical protein